MACLEGELFKAVGRQASHSQTHMHTHIYIHTHAHTPAYAHTQYLATQ